MVESIGVWICKQNIDLFQRKLLEAAADGSDRNALIQMLAQEQARLDQLTAAQQSSGFPTESHWAGHIESNPGEA